MLTFLVVRMTICRQEHATRRSWPPESRHRHMRSRSVRKLAASQETRENRCVSWEHGGCGGQTEVVAGQPYKSQPPNYSRNQPDIPWCGSRVNTAQRHTPNDLNGGGELNGTCFGAAR